MASQIDKEKIRRKNFIIELAIYLVIYLYVVFCVLHYNAIIHQNVRMDSITAFNQCFIDVFTNPLNIFPITGKLISILFAVTAILGGFLMVHITEKKVKKHDNPDTVNGEAHLMTLEELKAYNLKFSSPLGKPDNSGANNMIISKDIRLAIDNKGTRRNCNILAIGGSGAGKSRFFAAPNILQYNCNFVITDPSGEMYRDYAKGLEDNGYEVLAFNMTDVYRSNRYNPFHYIKEEKDVFTLVNTLIKNTTPPDGHGGDPFWENSEKLLLTALILYLWHVYPPENQTFANVLKLISMAEIDENDATANSPLDILFKDLEKEDPENLAISQYKRFKLGAGKTLKSILISVGVRLQIFELSDIKYLTSTDDFHFENFSDTKKALFVIIPTADTTFNFIVSLLYSQLFSTQYTYAETRAEYGWKASIDPITPIKVVQSTQSGSEEARAKLQKYVDEIHYGINIKYDNVKKLYKAYTIRTKELVGWRGTKEEMLKFVDKLKNIQIEKCSAKCPVHVRLILDEFANIGQIPDFDQKLATMRKYEISCSIILQALSQLKDIYKEKWNTIVSNCDTKLFLGCDDTETIEWMLKMLGKRTTTVQNISFQAKGQGSTSYNKSSIELLTIDQISMMQDDECLVRIRGVRPYYGKKYELTEHPNYAYAQKTAGQFVIPLSKDVSNRRTGPLRDQKKKENVEVQKTIINAETPKAANPTPNFIREEKTDNQRKAPQPSADKEKKAVNTKQAPEQTSQKQILPEQDDMRRKVQNAARKIEATRAKEDLAAFDDNFDCGSEATILQSMGITPEATDTEIKEAIESMVILDSLPDDKITYAMTN